MILRVRRELDYKKENRRKRTYPRLHFSVHLSCGDCFPLEVLQCHRLLPLARGGGLQPLVVEVDKLRQSKGAETGVALSYAMILREDIARRSELRRPVVVGRGEMLVTVTEINLAVAERNVHVLRMLRYFAEVLAPLTAL